MNAVVSARSAVVLRAFFTPLTVARMVEEDRSTTVTVPATRAMAPSRLSNSASSVTPKITRRTSAGADRWSHRMASAVVFPRSARPSRSIGTRRNPASVSAWLMPSPARLAGMALPRASVSTTRSAVGISRARERPTNRCTARALTNPASTASRSARSSSGNSRSSAPTRDRSSRAVTVSSPIIVTAGWAKRTSPSASLARTCVRTVTRDPRASRYETSTGAPATGRTRPASVTVSLNTTGAAGMLPAGVAPGPETASMASPRVRSTARCSDRSSTAGAIRSPSSRARDAATAAWR